MKWSGAPTATGQVVPEVGAQAAALRAAALTFPRASNSMMYPNSLISPDSDMVTALHKLWRTEAGASNLVGLFFFFSFSLLFSPTFAKRPASMLLTRENEKAGKQVKSGVGGEEGHRGLLGSPC